MPGRTETGTASGIARALAVLYAALSIAHTASERSRFRAGEWATKPLLMPVLTACFLVAGGRRVRWLPMAGMLLGGLGDTALLASKQSRKADTWFLTGMGCFAAGHACYIAAFARDGAAGRVRPPVAAASAGLWAALNLALWPRLEVTWRVPVAIYSALVVAMAALASGRNRTAAAGGTLFVLSDALIALGMADLRIAPGQEAAIMPTYVTAQYLLAKSWLRPKTPQAVTR